LLHLYAQIRYARRSKRGNSSSTTNSNTFSMQRLTLRLDTSTTVLASILLPLHESFTPPIRWYILRPLLKSATETWLQSDRIAAVTNRNVPNRNQFLKGYPKGPPFRVPLGNKEKQSHKQKQSHKEKQSHHCCWRKKGLLMH